MIASLLACICYLTTPVEDQMVVVGKASFYADSYEGKTMANGKPYVPYHYTCASWDWPLGTMLLVEYRSAAGAVRCVIVTVTDRGPSRFFRQKGRVIDLSKAAFRALENLDRGLIQVRVQKIK